MMETATHTAAPNAALISSEQEPELRQRTNHKSIAPATLRELPLTVAHARPYRRKVGHRFFLLYRHVLGLLAGSHLAYVNNLPPDKRKFLNSPGARVLAFLLRPFVKKELRDRPFAVQLRRRLEMLGPTYVKLGQIMAIREDILPKEITDELRQLLDRLPEVPFAAVRQIIEASLGKPLEDLFLDIQESAIGSASIAQTHLAKTKLGETVVVKVIKPGIREAILSDIKLLQLLARLLEELIPRYQPEMIINEFCAYTEREIDLTYEADHAEIFAANFAHQPEVVFPKIYRALSSRDVLCMEYFDGWKPNDPHVRQFSSSEIQKIIDLGAGAIIKMLYADGFFHADLHTGNLIVLPGPRVGFIDVGMVGRFDEKMKLSMLYYFYSLVNGDIEGSAKYLMAMARIGEGGDVIGFRRSVSDLFRRYLLRASDGRLSLAQLILASLRIGGKYRIFFPVEMTLMVKALVTFEGVGLQLDPNLDVPALSRRHIRAIYSEHYDPMRLFQQFMSGLPEMVDVLVRAPEFISESSRYLQQLFNAPRPESPVIGLRSGLMAGSCIIGGVIAFVAGAPPLLWAGLFASSVVFFFLRK
ncbi:ubiquinone biosynthesis protein UbiB [candidate division KSB1 bacterium]|nr:MAG: ubiquinone biosynthesis protein UbiB [candidate division KSB1 bacterium]